MTVRVFMSLAPRALTHRNVASPAILAEAQTRQIHPIAVRSTNSKGTFL